MLHWCRINIFKVVTLLGTCLLYTSDVYKRQEVLFGKLRIAEKPKMTRTKQFSTEEEYLQTFAHKYEIVDKILEYLSLIHIY